MNTHNKDNVFEGDYVETCYPEDGVLQVTSTTENGFNSQSPFGEHIHLPYSYITRLYLESEGYDLYHCQ